MMDKEGAKSPLETLGNSLAQMDVCQTLGINGRKK